MQPLIITTPLPNSKVSLASNFWLLWVCSSKQRSTQIYNPSFLMLENTIWFHFYSRFLMILNFKSFCVHIKKYPYPTVFSRRYGITPSPSACAMLDDFHLSETGWNRVRSRDNFTVENLTNTSVRRSKLTSIAMKFNWFYSSETMG